MGGIVTLVVRAKVEQNHDFIPTGNFAPTPVFHDIPPPPVEVVAAPGIFERIPNFIFQNYQSCLKNVLPVAKLRKILQNQIFSEFPGKKNEKEEAPHKISAKGDRLVKYGLLVTLKLSWGLFLKSKHDQLGCS